MSKYIKLEDAIHNINLEVTGRKEYTGDMKANLFFALDELSTIDIVHCKECKHWSEEFHDCGIRDSYGWDYKPTDYCSEGEGIDNE